MPYDCLNDQFPDVYEQAVNYGIDPAFVIATWAWETGWGKSDLWIYDNNPAGIRCGNEYCVFPSKEAGIESLLKNLRYYIDELGRATIQDVRALWSETDDAEGIVQIMREIVE